ncbi:MAG: helix-turn-helix domain-containing protein [Alphaproteobacteria bacterium]|nr:helix-turn-helix domain-containing protein [Alphaproteobacteria bacterium]MDE2112915.1 helix-turn-helix domain-containing protein [Alphaproteobacteria bacterium]MDE2493784.1 helix-turn-helix domain-containing protein [Alphaproteobacteria bacterium]
MHDKNGTRQRNNTLRRNVRNPAAKESVKNKNDEVRRAMRARNGSPFLTTKEAAFYLGRKPRTLKRWRQQGKGPPYRLAERSVLYHIDEIDDWSLYSVE